MLRTFSLNSREFHEAVREPSERPWIPNGSLPAAPRARDREALRAQDVWGTSEHAKVEPGTRRSRGGR
ncbi:MAG: hypothetical protein ACJ8FS_09555 [Sphingomicrobium sp.]